jgi:uncharacterized membrane protein
MAFYHLCYQLKLRFKRINSQLDALKNISLSKGALKHLMNLMKEHNSICYDLYQYNHFWRFQLFFYHFFFPIIVQLMFYVGLFADVPFLVRWICTFAGISVYVLLSIPSELAAMVNKQVSKYMTSDLFN